MKFTEAQLESAIIELLGVEGYPHVLGKAIERQPQEVLIKADLRACMDKPYAADHITPLNTSQCRDRAPKYAQELGSRHKSRHRVAIDQVSENSGQPVVPRRSPDLTASSPDLNRNVAGLSSCS